MARPCSVCQHPDRQAVDVAIVAGESAARITAKFREISDDAVLRHGASHLPARLAQAREAAEAAQADDLLKEVRALRAKAYSLLLQAERQGDIRTALAGIREARGCLELLAKLLGELDDRPQVVLVTSPEWLGLRGAILRALEPYPQARLALVEAIGSTNGHAD